MYAAQSSLRYWWSPACRGPWATISLYGTGKATVRAGIVEPVKALNAILIAYDYRTRYADTGAFNCRQVTGGSTYSLHAYGIAIDINWLTNPYSRTLRTDMFIKDGQMPRRIEAIRTNNGKQVWRWGGWFSGNRDSMHYEVTCSPADIRTGINWSTVYKSTTPTPTPTLPSGDLVYRILKFRGEPTAEGNQTDVAALYRCIMAKGEKVGRYIPVEAYHIANDLTFWEARLQSDPTERAISSYLKTVQFHGGPFDNTK